jgi:hypothetical protein
VIAAIALALEDRVMAHGAEYDTVRNGCAYLAAAREDVLGRFRFAFLSVSSVFVAPGFDILVELYILSLLLLFSRHI